MSLLLPYQCALWRLLDSHSVVICEKSRRIGMTWAAAAYAVLHAARARAQGGSDVLYIGYNLEMTGEFIAVARQWLTAMEASSVHLSETGVSNTRTTLRLCSGHAIKALPSSARSLRGRQGLVIIDEAAFHEDLPALMKAALALLIWRGKLLVISTHFGKQNAFYRLSEAIHRGEYNYALLRVTFNDALQEGLYARIARMSGTVYSPEAESAWAAKIRADYGEAAAEELDCIPGEHEGQYFPRSLLERATAHEGEVLRYDARESGDLADWIAHRLEPSCAVLPRTLCSAVGVDFGRHHDLSVFYVLQIAADLSRRSALIVEVARTPFEQQWKLLRTLLERLPRLGQVLMDKGGIGGYLHEQTETHFGRSMVRGMQLSRAWYAERMPKLKAAFEQECLSLPKDSVLIEDLCQIAVIDNVPRPHGRRQGRHADAAIALCLAHQASDADRPGLDAVHSGAHRLFSAGDIAGDIAEDMGF